MAIEAQKWPLGRLNGHWDEKMAIGTPLCAKMAIGTPLCAKMAIEAQKWPLGRLNGHWDEKMAIGTPLCTKMAIEAQKWPLGRKNGHWDAFVRQSWLGGLAYFHDNMAVHGAFVIDYQSAILAGLNLFWPCRELYIPLHRLLKRRGQHLLALDDPRAIERT